MQTEWAILSPAVKVKYITGRVRLVRVAATVNIVYRSFEYLLCTKAYLGVHDVHFHK